MKRIFIVAIALLMFIMSGCSFDESSEQESVLEGITEASSQTVETTEKVTETEAVQTETTPTEIMSLEMLPKAEKLNLGEVDEWSFNSRSKFIYFTDYGRYYPVETSEFTNENYRYDCRDSGYHDAIYDLCLDDGIEKTILDNTGNCMSYYCDGNSVYIHKYDDYDTHDNDGIYKLYKDGLTKLVDYPDNGYISAICFTDSQIYYSIFAEKKSAVYQMDYEGNNTEHIFDNPTHIRDMTVYDGKIWYERSYGRDEIYGLACYDLKTGESKEFKRFNIGFINNNYMYFNETYSLYRMDLSNYKCETVFTNDDDNYLSAFDFYGDYILYSSGESIYRLSDNENTLIFSANDFLSGEDYKNISIQCQDNRIFIKIGVKAFYQCIMEIDIDGNVIEVIHED